MPVYYVTTKEVHEVMYRVTADSPEEAEEMAYEGDPQAVVEEDSFDSFLKDETTVEEFED